jgi:hypothetical protein
VGSDTKRRRFANGPPRPQYLADVDVDKAVMMMLSLAAEVSALRERLDTHERLAEGAQPPTPATVEAYAPTEVVEAARARARRELIDRVTRVLLESGPGADHVADVPEDPHD